MDSSRVLEEVMGTAPRDKSVERLIEQIFHSIDVDQFAEARSLLTAVEAKIGSDDPEVTRARALMTFLESES